MDEVYADRREAGRVLAAAVMGLPAGREAVVLALPRGGVPVGYEVARALRAPLDVVVVRKLGVPGHRELAMGAIASGGARVLNEEVIQTLGIPEAEIERIAVEEWAELGRRELAYRGGRPAAAVAGKRAILVDDGLATGASMRAAVTAVREQGPAEIVVAVPVAARETVEVFRGLVEQVVCPVVPEEFYAVGLWYQDFSATTDEEVGALLARSEKGEG